MLESTVIGRNGKKRGKRLFLLPISIAIHLMLIAGALLATVWRVDLPESAPVQIASFRTALEVPLPPPAPPPPRHTAEPVQQPQQEPVTPVVVPQQLPQLAQPGAASGAAEGSEEGEEDGQIGGTPGGTPGSLTLEPPAQPAPTIHPVGGAVQRPQIILRVEPRYPEQARRSRLEGWVVIECVVDRTGQTQNLRVVGSSNGIFEPAAIDALRQWRFAAGTLNGVPVDTRFTLRVNFLLD